MREKVQYENRESENNVRYGGPGDDMGVGFGGLDERMLNRLAETARFERARELNTP